ncbi:hypothetical protein NKH77_02670 [Streptomyces sp. M19]
MVAAAYEEIAETRPRIRRDVLFTRTPDGVLFHNARGGFHLNAKSAYRFSTLIVPHLTGEHRVADLCAGLGEQQRAMVAGLVKTLYERGFARDVPAPSPAAGPPRPRRGAAVRRPDRVRGPLRRRRRGALRPVPRHPRGRRRRRPRGPLVRPQPDPQRLRRRRVLPGVDTRATTSPKSSTRRGN